MRRTTIVIICAFAIATLCAADSLHVRCKGHYGASNSARRVHVSGAYAYIADDDNGLCIIDVSEPSSPSGLVHYYTGDPPFEVYVCGNYAYVTYAGYFSWKGLQIFDVSYPSSPFEVGLYEMGDRAYGIYVSDDYAYVADGDSGLRIIDVSTPSSPSEVGFYDTEDRAFGVYVSDSYAYVADKEDGLRIIDVSDPSSPSEVGFYNTGDLALDVYIYGNYAYIADYEDGLRIIDISEPSSPTEVGFYITAGGAISVHVSGSYAYIADEFNGLQIIDISSPSSPFRAGFYNTTYYAVDVFVSDRYAYIACGDSGLYIFDISYFTGIEEGDAARPGNIALSAYPNPFNSAVTISLSVIPGLTRNPEAMVAEIFDINGRMVAEIIPPNPPHILFAERFFVFLLLGVENNKRVHRDVSTNPPGEKRHEKIAPHPDCSPLKPRRYLELKAPIFEARQAENRTLKRKDKNESVRRNRCFKEHARFGSACRE